MTVWRMHRSAHALGLLLVWASIHVPVAQATGTKPLYVVSIGNPARAAQLPTELAEAHAHGAVDIKINPGVYRLPKTANANKPVFNLVRWRHVVIGGHHVILVMRSTDSGDCFRLDRCRHVTIEGLTIIQTRLTFYQGKITAVHNTKAGLTCNWRCAAGYPCPDAHAKGFPASQFQATTKGRVLFNLVDRETRRLSRGVPDLWGRVTPLGSRLWRVAFQGPRLPLKVGDWLVSRYGNWPRKIFLDHSRDCTVRGVTLMRNDFAPIFENYGGGNRLLDDRWVPGPKPAGARQAPLVTNEADGFHSIGAEPGPSVEHCVFRGVFLDDCIAIHGFFQQVIAGSGRNLTIREHAARPYMHADLRVGEPIQISDTHGFFAVARVVSIKCHRNHTVTVTLDRSLAVPADADVTNPDHCGQGYRIIDCRLGDTRSRGIIAKANNGIILNNTIRGCGMAGICIGPELVHWYEAGYCHNVIIEGNTLSHNGKGGGNNAAIYVHGAVYGCQHPNAGAMGNSGIVIRDNTLAANYPGGIRMTWTDGGVIRGNWFIGGPPSVATSHCVLVRH